jgi:hypothetical protein
VFLWLHLVREAHSETIEQGDRKMKLDTASMSVVGATIVLALSTASAPAQAKPKSQKRIPISKESGGEVAPRVDTVTVYRTDTLTKTIYHTDTMVKTILRVDSVMLQPPVLPIRMPAGLYFGLAGGSTAPDGSIFTPNSVGYIGQMHLGWQNAKQVLGGRISGTYSGLGEDTQFSRGDNAKLWTFSTDLKLNLPLGHTFGMTPKLALYGIGGWTYTWFKHLPARLDTPDNFPPAFVFGDSDWTGRNGWDAGGGLSLLWGRSEVFVESRVLGFTMPNSPQARQIPIVFGFNWY